MSFAFTTPQFVARTKTVTRRAGWLFLKPDDVVMGVEKGQGLKKGETVNRLHPIRVVSVRREPLRRMLDDPEYGRSECVREGFPEESPAEFVARWPDPDMDVTRVEFEHLVRETADPEGEG